MLLTIAWRNLWRQKRRSLVTSLALALGVALSMACICFQDGFYNVMNRVMVEQRLGHVQIHQKDYPGRRAMHDTLTGAKERLKALQALEGVGRVTGRLRGQVLIGGARKSEGGEILGIDPTLEEAFTGVSGMVTEGRFLGAEAAREIVLGGGLADTIDAEVGDEIVLLTQSADGSMGNDLYTFVGRVTTGSMAIDRYGGYLHLADLQDLLVLEDSLHEITLTTASGDGADAGALATLLKERVDDDSLVRTWQEVDPQVAEMMKMQSVAAGIILFFVLGAAAFVVLNTMMMAVFERTRELGVLMSLGMRPRRIVGLVLTEALVLSCLSIAIGLTLGGLLDWYLVTQGVHLMEGNMDFMGVRMPGTIQGFVEPRSVVMTLVAGVLFSVMAAAWPSWRASRLRPVEAMRQN
jgi:ABC-type lipoprotein release transport system permease subunit